MARLVRASEIGEYVYCHRAWWLHIVEGWTPDSRRRLEAGRRHHRRHGRRVSLSHGLLIAGGLLLALGIAGLLWVS